MKVLLTGASGFVGSHILDVLSARGLSVALLLRSTSSREFLRPATAGASSNPAPVEIRTGSINDLTSLEAALEGITHVIHCAGATKAQKNAEFYVINQLGTRNVVSAVNARGQQIQRLLHISSLAVTGPATPQNPARESSACQPISSYGKSKLLAENEVREQCDVPFTIIRPPAVYGPRDNGFLSMFKAVCRHVLPRPSATQSLSLVYVEDLATAVVEALLNPSAEGKTYFASHPEIVTGRQMADQIAQLVNHWTVPCPMPAALLWPMCLGQEIFAQLTGKPMLLNLQKYAELRAPGWVCDSSLIRKELGVSFTNSLELGVPKTLAWYRQQKWL